MSEFYKSEIEPIDLSVFRRLVLSDDYRKAYNLVAEYTVAITEERIIKLLEAKADQAMRAGQGKPMPERMEYLAVETSIRQVIALIKGENK